MPRLKGHVDNITDQVRKRDDDGLYIALEHVEGWTGRFSTDGNDVRFDSQVKGFQAGDVLFGKLRPYLAKVTTPSRGGVCVGEFLVLRRNSNNLLPRYLEYILRSKPVIEAINASTFGAKMPRTDWNFIGNMEQPSPSFSEQAAIVRYLDAAEQQIQAYISAKQKLIALLEEQRQAIIHQAVTRGLCPNVRLKPSGVEWLGEVPEHWEVRRLKQLVFIQAGITIGSNQGDSELIERPYLRVANVQSGQLDLSNITTIQASLSEIKRSTLKKGDVLMTEGGDIDKLGRGCIWTGDIPDCLHQNHVFAVRPNPTDLLPGFLVALMGSLQARTYFYTTAKQTTNLAATNRTTLGNLPIYLPSIAEQQDVLSLIEENARKSEYTITHSRRQIELMEEYRTRLIADVVTGKLDVRDAAEELPQPEPAEIAD